MTVSTAQAKRDRKALHKAIARDLRVKARQKVKELREAVRSAKKSRRSLHAAATSRCKALRVEARQKAEERRKRALSELSAANRQARELARFVCSSGKSRAKEHGHGTLKKARAELAAERQYQAEMKAIVRANKRQKPRLARARARRSESDDEVRQNLQPDMLALFERVRGQIKGNDRKSRTEAFLEYAAEHPRELLGALDDVAEQRIRQLEREHRQAHKASRRKKYSAAELAAVPF